MAKYSKRAGEKVERAMKEMKQGKLRSGRSEKKSPILNKLLLSAYRKPVKKEQKFLIKEQPGKRLLPDRPLSL